MVPVATRLVAAADRGHAVKGLVLAGGRGSRLRPITFSMAKQLIPIANKPIIEYGLEDLVAAGVTDIGIVVSPETGAQIRKAVTRAADRIGFTPTFIVQEKPAGLAHALQTALPFIDGDHCLMYLGDNLVKDGVADVVEAFESGRANCQILLSRVDDPTAFGVAELDDAGAVIRLIEKPKDPPSDLALVGVYLFDETISSAVAAIAPSARGEYEITDAIQHLIDTGSDVQSTIVSGWWKDTGTKDDLLSAQHLVIADLTPEMSGQVAGSTTITGSVRVGRDSTLTDCTVTGPVVIGEGASLRSAVIGPYTSVGDGCEVIDAAIEDSIVMEGCRVTGWNLRASVLGHDARLGPAGPNGPVEMTLGERSEVGAA